MHRARDKSGQLIEPMTLANMRAMGVRSIDAICSGTLCGHSGRIDASSLSDALPVDDVAQRLLALRR